MITHAKTIGVPVRDQQRALEFYTEKLGFEVRRDEPMGPATRWIEIGPKGAETCIVPFTPAFSSGSEKEIEGRIGTFTGIVFSCQDAEATYRELAGRGVEFSQKPRKEPWGGVSAVFADEDGNTFALVQDAS